LNVSELNFNKKEKSFLKPFIKVGELSDNYINYDTNNYLLYTENIDDIEVYPNIKEHLSKYKEILKHFSLQDINQSMINAKKDYFHLENDYKYCTLEYFSRIEQIDKWLNATKEHKKSDFIFEPNQP
jgi:hypothetical protein